MANFQITFFRTALKAGIEAREAQELTETTEDFIVKTVDAANKDLVAKLDTMTGKLGNIETKLSLTKLQIGFILAVGAVTGSIGTAIAKLIHIG